MGVRREREVSREAIFEERKELEDWREARVVSCEWLEEVRSSISSLSDWGSRVEEGGGGVEGGGEDCIVCLCVFVCVSVCECVRLSFRR